MKKKLAAKLWFFARCNERVSGENFFRYLHLRIMAGVNGVVPLTQVPTL